MSAQSELRRESQYSVELPEHLVEIAFREFNETPELRSAALIDLRSRIEGLETIEDRLSDTSDKNLIRFLRSRKYDMDKTVESTISYQRFVNKHKDSLRDIKPDELAPFADFLNVIREPGASGRVVMIMRPGKGIKLFTPELKKENPHAMLRCNFWMFEKFSHDPQVQVCGLIVINTFQGLTMWDQMAMSSMAPIGDQLATFQHFQILGMRFKGAYIFEEPPFMSWLWFFIKPFMSEKIKSRFFLCGPNYEILKTAFEDLSILPTYLGGTIPDGDPGISRWMIDAIEEDRVALGAQNT